MVHFEPCNLGDKYRFGDPTRQKARTGMNRAGTELLGIEGR